MNTFTRLKLAMRTQRAFNSYRRTGNLNGLDMALSTYRELLASQPDNWMALSRIVSFLICRYKETGDPADLNEAIDAGRKVLAAAKPGFYEIGMYLSNLGNALLGRFELAGDLADLDEAIESLRRAVALGRPGARDLTTYRNLATYLSSYGLALVRRFEVAGDPADLEEAIEAVRRAIGCARPGDRNRAFFYSTLGGALHSRFVETGDAADLQEAIDCGRQALAAAPPGPSTASALAVLAAAFSARFEAAGDPADLDEAIEADRRALVTLPRDHPARAGHLSNLVRILQLRFELAGDRADLDEAIDAGREAIAAAPGHVYFFMFLGNHENTLRMRFELAGDRADLDEAIDIGRQTVAIPSRQPVRAKLLSNQGSNLFRRFEATGDNADLDEAIDLGRQALAALPAGDPSAAGLLSNLGNFLSWRYRGSGDSADLDEAVSLGRQATAAIPSEHPDLAMYLLNLADSLYTRYEHSQNATDLDEAITFWQQASKVKAGQPQIRLSAAEKSGFAAAKAGRFAEAFDSYTVAVGLLPVVAWHGLDRATRQEHLAKFGGLGANAAACAILANRPEAAVELLEQSRSVLWTQALNLRSRDLARLADKAPDLATRLDRIRDVLDAPVPDALPSLLMQTGSTTPADGATHSTRISEMRQRKAREWDELVNEVRAIKGFEHFLATPSYTELAQAPADGPVVIVNASVHGCHALIVSHTEDKPQVICLPGMSWDAVVDQDIKWLKSVAGVNDLERPFLEREQDRREMLNVLSWLWDVIAEPVLASLGHVSPHRPDTPWPRVWWCCTDSLTVLPIHAAGKYPALRTGRNHTGDCLPDRVISSYTPTLTALIRNRQSADFRPVRHLTIGMPTTPGKSSLPAVRAEVEVIARHFPPNDGNHQLIGSEASHDAVLSAIANHSWVHMACHASQERDPDRSGFSLWDASLTIADLASQIDQVRDLAFLSACETATGSVQHLDESIHLGAAMQFLGYRHVIATMWTVADSPAPYVSDVVYTELARGGRPDPNRSAQALHNATRELLQHDPSDPATWATYIHIGT